MPREMRSPEHLSQEAAQVATDPFHRKSESERSEAEGEPYIGTMPDKAHWPLGVLFRTWAPAGETQGGRTLPP